MAKLTIEGSLTPSAFLARGERRTVQHTPRIDRMVHRGFVVVVDAHDDDEPAEREEDRGRSRVIRSEGRQEETQTFHETPPSFSRSASVRRSSATSGMNSISR